MTDLSPKIAEALETADDALCRQMMHAWLCGERYGSCARRTGTKRPSPPSRRR